MTTKVVRVKSDDNEDDNFIFGQSVTEQRQLRPSALLRILLIQAESLQPPKSLSPLTPRFGILIAIKL